MVDRVLVPMDGSEMSVRALEYALDVHDDAEITVLYVAGEPSPMMGQALRLALETDVQRAAEELAEEVFEAARERAAAHGVEIETEVALGNPARQIVDRARRTPTRSCSGATAGPSGRRCSWGTSRERSRVERPSR